MLNQSTTILMIEDDPAVAHSLRSGLEQDGYQVIWKATGLEGATYARDHNPQLIILDVRLPDGSGFDFCRQMRQAGLRQPILMLTVQGEEMDKVLGLEMGADDYLTKPYSLRELLSRVRALLRRAYGEFSASSATLLYAGDLVIDLGRGQVWRGNQLIALTPTEFKLLIFLARHPGQALSRAQILDDVWGYGADVESERLVNVHVRRLREKVELDSSRPSLILTVPGIGYRLVG
ncbi:MAG: response regulator transcription factor [Chloroflexi bacterium]|nr:response regulator transcription factor [Chloroflexota bacterium]